MSEASRVMGGPDGDALLDAALSDGPDDEALRLMLNEVQLVLAEKRTSLAVIRTGIAVCALPLTLVGLLIATSKLYDVFSMTGLLVPLLIVCTIMLALGLYLMLRGFRAMHQQDLMIRELKRASPRLAEWLP